MPKLSDFTVKTITDEDFSLSEFDGKVTLIVNTATKCGFTPQYEGLQTLYDLYHEKGFEILDFPCNQFKQQASEDISDINQFCQLNYNTSFHRFNKIKVNGKETHPLYQWLKNEKKGPFGKVIEWNFAKFLVDRNGNVVERFSSKTEPKSMVDAIEKYL
ncbi:glutathione peroxidase [Streptococcus zalophi]|uniref:Glutathione peroxidase n=1 Tax=Streptococcus zalophi TaxID=640031 RepID=A0A934UCX2_9STRE|nr:glutathione peroxidase [Streptococcus zalophi]MBJ8349170.1 glutathione peroxidase [Streptococcus zalophi]MCR8967208.1 glutathione peroxidase [Streptococcus zalophi]